MISYTVLNGTQQLKPTATLCGLNQLRKIMKVINVGVSGFSSVCFLISGKSKLVLEEQSGLLDRRMLTNTLD